MTVAEPPATTAVEAMEKKDPRPEIYRHEEIRKPLLELHGALVKLHKALLDSERVVYERNVGPIRSPSHFFRLVTSDPWFAWLRPISRLIVAIDETLEERERLTSARIDWLMRQSVFLLIPAETGGEFGERYLAALQRDPRVVLAHGQVARRIGSRQSPA